VPRALQLLDSGSALETAAAPTRSEAGYSVPQTRTDDLSRNVFGVLGLSIDAIDFTTLLQSFETAAGNASPFLISTPNVNFLVTSQRNREFRESILLSDLCLADGMPLIWIAKLLRIPITERIAGADLFGRLKSMAGKGRRLRVFLLGGAEGVAESVCRKLNSEQCGLECVGVANPGFGSIEEMSTRPIIDAINSAQPDLLAVFFGAEKAQAWLMHNHDRLRASIRAQFGATINFEAGTVKRAPRFIRSTGFEWLWRIKEEPYLWRRYWNDGKVLFKLMITSVLPLVIDARFRRRKPHGLLVGVREEAHISVVDLSGDAVGLHVEQAIHHFRNVLNTGKQVTVDLSKTRSIDPRFFGLFLMVRKQLASHGKYLSFTGVSDQTRRMFRLNKFEFLLSHERMTERDESELRFGLTSTALS
jgi:N-acetylglucosaminyldiphosphoundecaprenol N-acetyl-beta-D-mannosaminyltransferase